MDSHTMDSGLPGGHAPAHWYDTWDRKTSQTFSNTAKGLRNAPGENNCFLNSAVQVFWHIDVFRRSYRRLSGHLCMGHSCIFCALKVIFTQFQYSDQASLQPSALRKALANTFAKQERFQLGHMDDAAECFENILNRIHYHIANSYNEDACNAPHCITHQKFAMTVFDQLVCPCGATSEPLKFHEMVHYISANALVSQSRTMQETGDMLHPNRFGLLLRNAGAVGDVRDCPGNCGKRVQIRRTLLNAPDVVSIGLVWGSDKADSELAAEVTRNIGTTILFPDMFHSVMCQDASQLPRLHLTSVVCYYGKHYSTFIFHTKLQEWVYFDDATVRQVGKKWEQVVERIIRSRYQPLLLIYTNANAQPVPTETAPSTRVMAPGYSMTPGKGQEQNKERPSLPEKVQTGSRIPASKTDQNQSGDGREKEPLERTSSFEHRRQSSFMLAVTKQKNKEEPIYAVPHNNSKVMNAQKDLSQADPRHGYMKQSSSGSVLADIPDGPEDSESYNYTLSNSDQYRRPGLNVSEPNHRLAMTQNFSRGNEQQRKDSFKKGKGKVGADVIRYHVDGSRRSSLSSESDANSPVNETPNGPLPVTSNKPALPMKPKNMQMRSQSVDEGKPDMPDGSNKLSHKVIKPMPASLPVYDNGDGVTRAHTPVQSGLATLPRNKKSSNNSSSNMTSSSSSSSTTMSHAQSRAGSQHMAANQQQYHPENPPPPYNAHSNHPVVTGYQNCLTYQNVVDNEIHSRQSSTSSILSTGTVVECPIGDGSHNRQVSTASQDTLTDKPKEQRSKSKKKDKEERKRDESRQRKEEKKGKSKKEKSSKSDKPPPVPDKKGNGLPDEGFSEEKYYIDRRMVESVLSAQKLQRSGSCVSQASNSSMESAESYNRAKGITPKDNLSSDIPFDAASLDSHKDSGYASSDRNSSSSTGSITMNPYEQYFLSRSMIPPKTINQQAAENMRKLMNQGPGINGLEYTQEKDLKSLVTNPNEYYNQTSIVGHVANNTVASKSGPMQQPKDLMSLSKADREQHLFDALSGRSKVVQPPQVPNKLQSGQHFGGLGYGQGQGGINQTGYPSDKGLTQPQTDSYGHPVQHAASRNQEPPKQSFHEGTQSSNELFMNLCQKAEDFMDSCVLAETSEQYSQALGFCQQAIDLLKNAMRMQNLSQSLYTMAQKKSNSCVIKFRSLQKRLMLRQESNHSTNSSDSGIVQDIRGQKMSSHFHVPHNGVKPPSRSSSQNSMDSLGSSCRSSTPVFDKVMRPSTDERVPSMEPHMPHAIYQNSNRDRSFETNIPDSNMNNADLYGTLPRRKTQKSQDHIRQSGSQQHEADVYNDFLEGQRRQSGNHSRTSSGARTPVNEVDFPVNYSTNSEQAYHHGDRSHYSANSAFPTGHHAGIKPIPVAPPKIENQSHHTEVGYQSKCWELPVSTGQPIRHQPANQIINHDPCYKHSQWNVGGAFHGDFINNPPVARSNIYGSLPSHVRNGNKAAKMHNNTSGIVRTAYSTQLQTTSANLCEPVTPKTTDHLWSANGSRSSEKRRQLDRSASFTYCSRPSSFKQTKSYQDSSPFPCSSQLIDSKRNGKSQPDLRKLSAESVNVPQRPLTPQVLCTESNEPDEGRAVSVRALTSRFESANVSGENRIEDQRTRSVQMNNVNSHLHLTHNNSVPSNLQQPSRVPLQRQRSKSESESLVQQPPRPKSVLAKKCKNSERLNKPRKSVTFSDNICLVAAAHDFGIVGNSNHVTQSGYQSDEEGRNRDTMSRISGQKVDDTDSSTSDSPVEIVGEGACTLCHKKGVELGHHYCINCSNYLNRFDPR